MRNPFGHPGRGKNLTSLLLPLITTVLVLAACTGPSSPAGPKTPEPTPPEPAPGVGHYRVAGDLSSAVQWLKVVDVRDGRDETVADAEVTVNGVRAEFQPSSGYYRVLLEPALAPGDSLRAVIGIGTDELTVTGEVPAPARIVAPARGDALAPDAPVVVRWEHSGSTGSFEISAWGTDGEATIVTVDDGASREASLAVDGLPTDGTPVTVQVIAHHDATISGPVTADSRAIIESPWSAEASSEFVISASPIRTKYRIVGGLMGHFYQNVRVWRVENGIVDWNAVDDATLTVNGVPLAWRPAGFYYGELPTALSSGDLVQLRVEVDGETIDASGTVPVTPVVTGPTNGTTFTAGSDVVVTWSTPTNADRYEVRATWNDGTTGQSFPVPDPDARSATIPPGHLPTDGREIVLNIVAFNDGEFSGDAYDEGSAMAIAMYPLESAAPKIRITE